MVSKQMLSTNSDSATPKHRENGSGGLAGARDGCLHVSPWSWPLASLYIKVSPSFFRQRGYGEFCYLVNSFFWHHKTRKMIDLSAPTRTPNLHGKFTTARWPILDFIHENSSSGLQWLTFIWQDYNNINLYKIVWNPVIQGLESHRQLISHI